MAQPNNGNTTTRSLPGTFNSTSTQTDTFEEPSNKAPKVQSESKGSDSTSKNDQGRVGGGSSQVGGGVSVQPSHGASVAREVPREGSGEFKYTLWVSPLWQVVHVEGEAGYQGPLVDGFSSLLFALAGALFCLGLGMGLAVVILASKWNGRLDGLE